MGTAWRCRSGSSGGGIASANGAGVGGGGDVAHQPGSTSSGDWDEFDYSKVYAALNVADMKDKHQADVKKGAGAL